MSTDEKTVDSGRFLPRQQCIGLSSMTVRTTATVSSRKSVGLGFQGVNWRRLLNFGHLSFLCKTLRNLVNILFIMFRKYSHLVSEKWPSPGQKSQDVAPRAPSPYLHIWSYVWRFTLAHKYSKGGGNMLRKLFFLIVHGQKQEYYNLKSPSTFLCSFSSSI